MTIRLPLKRLATDRDRKKACKELAKAFGYHHLTPVPPWLDNTAAGKAAIFELMVQYHLFPSRQNGDDSDLIVIKYGTRFDDVRVVPVSEHESKEAAIAFGIVLALTTLFDVQEHTRNIYSTVH
jgi:hypothetical protein